MSGQQLSAARPSLPLLAAELACLGTWVRARISPRASDIGAAASEAAAGAPVMTLPGFLAADVSMAQMRQDLNAAGFRARGWKQGFNRGATADLIERLDTRVRAIAEQEGRPVHLVGWSLGGVFAREYAKHHPDVVASVTTMGSPFSGSRRANNAWRVYRVVAGHDVESPPLDFHPDARPPVPTYALWSRRDGVVAPASAAGLESERDRAIEVPCRHLAFAFSPDVTRAVVACIGEAEALRLAAGR